MIEPKPNNRPPKKSARDKPPRPSSSPAMPLDGRGSVPGIALAPEATPQFSNSPGSLHRARELEMMTQQLLRAQTPWGRWQMRLYVTWKRVAWRWIVSGSLRLKRGLDIVGSLLFLIVGAPVFLLIAMLIKLEDRGPAFFAQTRVGMFGRHFKMYKFRSMRVDAEARLHEVLGQNQHQQGITFKVKNDPRITRLGKWLRKLSLDELPQFYNVLIGDMSLVGPRPPVPREVALYTLSDRRRLAVTPGITCLWQIGGRAEIDFPGQVALDVQYIESRTFWTDVKILFKTVPAVLFSKGAY